jgi:uncharacterized protein YggU (UPF0235/DUF167 family)
VKLTVYVQEQAVDGKANDAVLRVLATYLDVPRNQIEMVSGARSRMKRFRVNR